MKEGERKMGGAFLGEEGRQRNGEGTCHWLTTSIRHRDMPSSSPFCCLRGGAFCLASHSLMHSILLLPFHCPAGPTPASAIVLLSSLLLATALGGASPSTGSSTSITSPVTRSRVGEASLCCELN